MNKIKSIKELRKICQGSKFKSSAYEGSAYERKVLRKCSIYFTKLSLMIGISANQITVISILFTVLSFIPLLWLSNWLMVVLSAVLLNISYLLDMSDGEIARYTKSTYYGRLLDVAGHDIFYIVFIFIGFGIYSITNSMVFLIAGISASVFKLLFRLHEMRFEYMNITECLTKKSKKGGRVSGALYDIGLAQVFLPILFIAALLVQVHTIFMQAFLLFYAVYLPVYWIAWMARKRTWKRKEGKGGSEMELWKRLRNGA